MARPQRTDFLQNHRFALFETSAMTTDRSAFFDREPVPGSDYIGCQSITIPEVSIESLEVNEGTEMFTHHVNVGRAMTGECTISMAVIPEKGVGLYSWVHRAIYGFGSPRKNFQVVHLTRSNALIPGRSYLLEGCIPSSYKIASDMEAGDDAISLEELTFHVHRVKLIQVTSVAALEQQIFNPFGVVNLPPSGFGL